MNAEEFLILVKEQARDFSLDWAEGDNVGVSKSAQQWLNSLSVEEKIFLREILQESLDNAFFKVFEIMDGVHSHNSTPIESSCSGTKISGKGCQQLHDLYANKI
ncbi:hypothetical protein [Salinivibrio costicola]|uniref:Uncharacterized protein n=1 Tax=Salinivibrio costicola TaxID=51367 RepID=A0ABX6KAZ0_SALCS|nr:hypothetical protein [Salinivibrio costicola]QIR07680.1 hypothetical protein HBA18_14840 [Salinivibrio costicola]